MTHTDEELIAIGMTRGIALACAMLADYNDDILARDIMNEAGMDRAECIAHGVDQFDMERLEDIFQMQEAEKI